MDTFFRCQYNPNQSQAMSVLSQQLSFRGRHRLAQILDQPNVRGCDWRSLVELMGLVFNVY